MWPYQFLCSAGWPCPPVGVHRIPLRKKERGEEGFSKGNAGKKKNPSPLLRTSSSKTKLLWDWLNGIHSLFPIKNMGNMDLHQYVQTQHSCIRLCREYQDGKVWHPSRWLNSSQTHTTACPPEEQVHAHTCYFPDGTALSTGQHEPERGSVISK